MAGVGHERIAVQPLREQGLAGPAGLVLIHIAETQPFPGLRIAFDDKGRGVVIEAVGVGPDPAVFCFHKDESEGLEHLVRAQPDEFILPDLDVRLECVGELRADLRI